VGGVLVGTTGGRVEVGIADTGVVAVELVACEEVETIY
jgi:hypothetical protein